MKRKTRSKLTVLSLFGLASLVLSTAALAQADENVRPVKNERTVIERVDDDMCKLLDDPEVSGRMDGLYFLLMMTCGRQDELGKVASADASAGVSLKGQGAELKAGPGTTDPDAQVNNSAGETHPSATQSETSIVESQTTGTLCSSFNDSWEFFGSTGGGGLTGFSRSTDGGQTWQDGGAVGATAFGDPSLVWRAVDNNFYLATLASGGALAVWVSTDDCQTFSFLSTPSTSGDDKELLAVDNNPASPNFGNLYLVWTDFGFAGFPIRASRSTDGGVTWSAPVVVSTGGVVQGAWPAVAPNGDVFVAWVRYTVFQTGPITILVSRSTDGGLTYAPVTSPLVNAVSPRDAAASSACFRPALNGNIRYLASPQLAVDASGNLHVVYSYDPDGFNTGDVVNVYYRRSTTSGASWGPEIQLNDDATQNDQYFPTVQVNGNMVMATWYDRRPDPGNLFQDYFKRISINGGVSWFPSALTSDVPSPIVLDPFLATCYHGDYDQSVVTATGPRTQVSQWADDRNGDPDVWTDADNCMSGNMSGTWTTPFVVSQLFTGTVTGMMPGDPTVYNLTGIATPAGTIFGSWVGTNPNYPFLSFSGTWATDPGSSISGTFTATLSASGTSVGTMSASWFQIPGFTGSFSGGTWTICLN